SRLAAARRTTDVTEQFRLLSAAVKARPFADDVRVPLLRAALNSAHFQTAVDAIEPLAYNGNFLSRQSAAEGDEDVSDGDSSDTAQNSAEDTSDYEPTSEFVERMQAEQKGEVAAGLGLAWAKLDDPIQARQYLRTAYKLERDRARRRALNTKISELSALIELRQKNAERQPVIHKELEQPVVVHPKIAARATSANESPRKGVAQ